MICERQRYIELMEGQMFDAISDNPNDYTDACIKEWRQEILVDANSVDCACCGPVCKPAEKEEFKGRGMSRSAYVESLVQAEEEFLAFLRGSVGSVLAALPPVQLKL